VQSLNSDDFEFQRGIRGENMEREPMSIFHASDVVQPDSGSNNAVPAIDPANFTTRIDNPNMILRPGTTFVYADKGIASLDTMVVTHDTVVIDGVTCVAVHDTGYINGQLIEDTIDYYAQDKDGNVWYFGEDTKQYDPGNPVPIGDEGSWRAGVNGAAPGIIMEANSQVGDAYQQENAPGISEDRAKVISLDTSAVTDYARHAQDPGIDPARSNRRRVQAICGGSWRSSHHYVDRRI